MPLFNERGSINPPSMTSTGGGIFHCAIQFDRGAAHAALAADPDTVAEDYPWAPDTGDFVCELGTYDATTGAFAIVPGVPAVNAVYMADTDSLYAAVVVPGSGVVAASQTVYYYARFRATRRVGAVPVGNIRHGLTEAVRVV